MAGITGSGFDAADFRAGISFAMTMGLPQDTSERATFHFRQTISYPLGTRLDSEGKPFDLTIEPEVDGPEPVQIPCAVEFFGAYGEEGPVGVFESARAIITILDTNWPTVENAIEVTLGGDRYTIAYKEPPLGLFDVTIHRLRCEAIDET